MGDPREKPPDHPHAELGLSHMWPKRGSNPQRWDDERFRALKISDLNHLATGAALAKCVFRNIIILYEIKFIMLNIKFCYKNVLLPFN